MKSLSSSSLSSSLSSIGDNVAANQRTSANLTRLPTTSSLAEDTDDESEEVDDDFIDCIL
ncbi:hypothetical protein H5410_064815 [Solanum commersonii]|uniref:Uncharacterized protein n=1 Tax=Solanum commersonii TaxID=4109 RepID=A0A9J5VYC0_SOLCO|nr:hypothetical protein H5410_064815 [Solanum commersonii]